MKVGIGGLLLSLFTSFALAQQAVVAVVVTEKTVLRPAGSPFKSVGLFQVFRGGAKVEKSSCPDLSNSDGKLSCIIPCSAEDKVAGNFSIVPPDGSPRTKGYVAPPSQDVELLGCRVSPGTPREFAYVDSLLALRDLIQSDPLLTQLASTGDGGKTSTLGTPEKALPVFAELARKPGGVVKVIRLQKLYALAAEKTPGETDPQISQQFTIYSVGASNVLLSEIARTNAGIGGGALKITGATADYYSNLKTLEAGLEKKIGRSPQENLLLNDVQILRQSPYKGSQQTNIQRHLSIDRP